MVVFGGVLVARRIAAADMAAYEAYPQVHPGVAGLQALFAALRARLDIANLIEVCARRLHRAPLLPSVVPQHARQ